MLYLCKQYMDIIDQLIENGEFGDNNSSSQIVSEQSNSVDCSEYKHWIDILHIPGDLELVKNRFEFILDLHTRLFDEYEFQEISEKHLRIYYNYVERIRTEEVLTFSYCLYSIASNLMRPIIKLRSERDKPDFERPQYLITLSHVSRDGALIQSRLLENVIKEFNKIWGPKDRLYEIYKNMSYMFRMLNIEETGNSIGAYREFFYRYNLRTLVNIENMGHELGKKYGYHFAFEYWRKQEGFGGFPKPSIPDYDIPVSGTSFIEMYIQSKICKSIVYKTKLKYEHFEDKSYITNCYVCLKQYPFDINGPETLFRKYSEYFENATIISGNKTDKELSMRIDEILGDIPKSVEETQDKILKVLSEIKYDDIIEEMLPIHHKKHKKRKDS